MKYGELLKRITPLPWTITEHSSHYGAYCLGGINARVGHGDIDEAEKIDKANAEYLTLAANMLPELVVALKEIERDSDCGMSRDVARAALAKAERMG